MSDYESSDDELPISDIRKQHQSLLTELDEIIQMGYFDLEYKFIDDQSFKSHLQNLNKLHKKYKPKNRQPNPF